MINTFFKGLAAILVIIGIMGAAVYFPQIGIETLLTSGMFIVFTLLNVTTSYVNRQKERAQDERIDVLDNKLNQIINVLNRQKKVSK